MLPPVEEKFLRMREYVRPKSRQILCVEIAAVDAAALST